jgi:hypothetical protein
MRQGRPQHLQPLGCELRCHQSEPGDVAAWPCQAPNEVEQRRVDPDRHDGDLPGRFHRNAGGGTTGRYDHIDR